VAKLPEPTHGTVQRIYALHEDRRDNTPRPYLGASILGEPCARRLWLGFRWCGAEAFNGRMLRLFKTGDIFEGRVLQELREIGVKVEGEQHEVVACDGHMKGHIDAAALGLWEAPKTWHLVEAKTHNTKSFADLQKKGVRESKPKHWAQMMIYMGLTGMTRALYIAENKDTSELYTERVEFDKAEFDKLIAKAGRVIFAAEPPPRISTDAGWYECKFCPFHAQCHGEAVPAPTCRSCAHSTPIGNGEWHCDQYDAPIPLDAQREGCDEHRFIPALLERVAELVKADGNAVVWKNLLTGLPFDQPTYSSRDMATARDFRVIGDATMSSFKEVFGNDCQVLPGDEPEDGVLTWQTFANGSRHIRREVNGEFRGYLTQTPERIARMKELGDPAYGGDDLFRDDAQSVYGSAA